MRRSSPRPLSLPLERLRSELAPASALARVQAAWGEAVGAAVAEEAQPVSLVDGALLVECSSSVWAAELTMMARELCGRVNAAVAGDADDPIVSSLRCRTG
jgi:predicted nucleic acid-binding Zn ribbon protein